MAGRVIISLIALLSAVNALPQHTPWGWGFNQPNVAPILLQAACDLSPSTNSQVTGNLRLTQDATDVVRITGVVNGLAPGEHGFHIHQNGALGNDCKDAGPHFNPLNAPHGAPEDHHAHHHAGDYGNIHAGPDGQAAIDILSRGQISLTAGSPLLVAGRAVVVHALPDDLGRGGDEESTKTGNAGARVACCVITPAY